MYLDSDPHVFSRKSSFRRKYPVRLFFLLLIFTLVNPFPPRVALAQAVPNPPVQLLPADYAQITATGAGGTVATPPLAIPSFTWEPVKDTIDYRLEISQDINFNSNLKVYITPLTRYTPTTAAEFNDGIWYWRVRVNAPVASLYSPIRQFTRTWKSSDNYPVLVSPNAGVTVDFYDSPIFSWQPVLGAAAYRIQISKAYDFQPSNLIYNDVTLTTQHRPSAKLVNGSLYYWRVIPLDPAGREGTFSEARLLNQSYPFVPVQIAPANNSNPTFTPTFRWTAVRGAQFYHLQFSTDPSFNSAVNNLITRNTTFTTNYTMENDVNVYWHVRAYSGSSESAWSPTWLFKKQWYIKPVLLTPTNTFQFNRFPFFSWTPVPGAQFYRIQIDIDGDFQNNYIGADTSNPFYTPEVWNGSPGIMYWRVIPFDGNGKEGKPSLPFSLYKSAEFNVPSQVYPLYYYLPNYFPEDTSVSMSPYEDRTVGLPIFIWNRMTDIVTGELNAKSYCIQVSTSSDFSIPSNIVWEATTENQYVLPQYKTSNPTVSEFTPVEGQVYFWRVHGLNTTGAPCIEASFYGTSWSQIWKTRFSAAKRLPPTSGGAPQLLRPARGFEVVDSTPLFEWHPYQGASKYQIQVSQDSNFATANILVDSETPYPAFAPRQMLAQRNLGRLNFGTYYWKVRAYTSSWGSWSPTWRFQIASQSEWKFTRTPGAIENKIQVASDAIGETGMNSNYDLGSLYATQDTNFWFFGFDTPPGTGNADFILYLDTDHTDGVGVNHAPAGYSINIMPDFLPEYAFVIRKRANNFVAADVDVYKVVSYNDGQGNVTYDWGTREEFVDTGGSLTFDPAARYAEMKVWNTTIGMNISGGSYAMALFSLPVDSGSPQDSTPSDPDVPDSPSVPGNTITRFASVSERANLLYPFNDIEGDPTTHPSAPPFFWEHPSGTNGTHPWAGGRMEHHVDPAFTSVKGEFNLVSDTPYYSPTSHTMFSDIIGDNSYYWRFRMRYSWPAMPPFFGVWTQGVRFERRGFIPNNLTESTAFATPTFSWSITEGAQSYDLQVASDENFQVRLIEVNTTQNSYTPERTLPNGRYYWRVRARRYGGVINEWTSLTPSEHRYFDLVLPAPTGLTPHDPTASNVIRTTPTLCWNPVIQSVGSTPVLAAWRYRVQISFGDPTFSPGSYYSEDIETEQSCYTSRNGFPDGKYYWRVAMLDGEGRPSGFSQTAEFTKQYPITTLISPLSGNISQTPTFIWTPVNGASIYRLQISQYASYQPMYLEVNTNQISFTPTFRFEIGKTYYWRVAIVDRDGRVGPYTDGIIYINNFKVYCPLTVR